jgi:hypothetical protein
MPATTETEVPVAAKKRQPRGAGNAFRRTFLDELDERDEPSSAGEADYDGPWRVRPCVHQGVEGSGVFREHEQPPSDQPEAWFSHYEYASLAVSVLPSVGRCQHFALASEADSQEVFPVRHADETIGHLTNFNEALVLAMHVAESLVRSPASLASLLFAASTSAVRLVGRILVARQAQGREAPER